MTESLVLRFAAAQQSWGVGQFNRRLTATVPTRTGVIGHVAAALGAERGKLPGWLETLEIIVRVDRPGLVHTDFHTVNAPIAAVIPGRTNLNRFDGMKIDGKLPAGTAADFVTPNGSGGKWKIKGKAEPLVTERDFIADAEFIVAITAPDQARVAELHAATRNPVFMTYLGRKAYAPSFPYHLGTREGTPEEVLAALPTLDVNPKKTTGTDKPATPKALPLHRITGDQNYAFTHVTPPATDTITDWKIA